MGIIKVSVFLFLILECSFLRSLHAKSAGKFEQIVNKSVHVKRPPHIVSHISHFNPAQHEYEAQGNVLIEKEVHIEPENFEKNLRVQSPVFQTSSNDHFDVSQPNYDISGKIIINKDTPLLSLDPNIISDSSKFSLPKKEIFVKNSVRKVSHFKPSVNRFVVSHNSKKTDLFKTNPFLKHHTFNSQHTLTHKTIKKQDNSNKQHVRGLTVLVPGRTVGDYKKNVIVNKPKIVKKKVLFKPEQKFVNSKFLNTNNKFSVKKEVSINTPRRSSNTISHFTPQTLHFNAQGITSINRNSANKHVKIDKKFEAPQNKFVHKNLISNTKPSSLDSKFKKLPGHNLSLFLNKPTVIKKQVFVQPKQKFSNKFSIKKEVTVNTPKRVSGTISHFTPQQLTFNAKGATSLNRNSQAEHVKLSPKNVKISKNEVKPVKNLETPKTNKNRYNFGLKNTGHPVRVSVTKNVRKPVSTNPEKAVVVVFKKRIEQPKYVTNVKLQSKPVINKSLGFQSKKTVSIRTPERKSGVISHFTAPGHRFEAKGQVEIIGNKFSKTPAKKTIGAIPIFTPPAKPALVEPLPPKKFQIELKPQKTNLNNQGSFSGFDFNFGKAPANNYQDIYSGIDSYLPPNPGSGTGNTGNFLRLPTQKPPTRATTRRPLPPIRTIPTKPATKRPLPTRRPTKPTTRRPQPPNFNIVKTGFELEKKVQVDLEEHRVSIYDHFNPRGHHYHDVGDVHIRRGSAV